jgi:multidrug efflux pump subunit AcrB
MLVDNAIVVTDGILVRLQRGEDRRQAAIDVVQATQWPLLGGTAVGILAFSAIGLSPTDMGEYAGSLFWVILYSMLLSWVLAVTITPLLCVVFLEVKVRRRTPTRRPAAGAGPLPRRAAHAAAHRLGTGLALLALLAAGVVGFGFVTPGFMPESARPQFVVDMYLPQGTDIDITAAELAEPRRPSAPSLAFPMPRSFIGQGGLRFMLTYSPEEPNSAYGQLLVDVDDFRRIDPLVAELQEELTAAHPDAAIKVWKFMLGRGGGKKIEAAFRGPDPAVLRRLADEAKAVMAADPGAVAVQDDWREKVPGAAPGRGPVAPSAPAST